MFDFPDPLADFFLKYITGPFSNFCGLDPGIGSHTLSFKKIIFYFSFLLDIVYLFFYSLLWSNIPIPIVRHVLSILGGIFILLFDYGTYSTLFFVVVISVMYLLYCIKALRNHPFYISGVNFVVLFSVLYYYYIIAYGIWQMYFSF
jgi:hypothetical protein